VSVDWNAEDIRSSVPPSRPWLDSSRARIHELQISYEQLQQQLLASRECVHCGAFEHRMYFDYLEAQHRILEAVKRELMDSPSAVVYLELHGLN
jgi:hypothetical protein